MLPKQVLQYEYFHLRLKVHFFRHIGYFVWVQCTPLDCMDANHSMKQAGGWDKDYGKTSTGGH